MRPYHYQQLTQIGPYFVLAFTVAAKRWPLLGGTILQSFGHTYYQDWPSWDDFGTKWNEN